MLVCSSGQKRADIDCKPTHNSNHLKLTFFAFLQEHVPRPSAASSPEPALANTGMQDMANSLKKKAAARTKLSNGEPSSSKLLQADPVALPVASAVEPSQNKVKRKAAPLGFSVKSKKSKSSS